MRFCLLTGESLQEIVGEVADPGFISRFFAELPEKALHLGVRVILAVLCFAFGVQLIKLIRRLVKKSIQRANAEVGEIGRAHV